MLVDGSELAVTGSDGEVTVTLAVEVTNSSKGFCLVQPKRLIRWLGNLPKGETITVETDGAAEVRITPKTGQEYRFRTMVATFPAAAGAAKSMHDVDFSGLRAAVSAVRPAADEVSAGSSQQAVQVVSRAGNLYLHATDRLRLSRAVLVGAGSSEFSVVVEIKALEMAEKLGSTRLGVDPGGRVLVLEGPGHQVVVRTLDVVFPPVDMILESAPTYKVRVSQTDLSAALERLACVSDDSLPLVVDIDGSEMVLSTESLTVGGGRETVELASPAPSVVELGVNLGYLHSAIGSATSEMLEIGWSSPVMPLFVIASGHPEIISVVMPIKLGD